jgi:phosphoribosylaminoimidazolecarboxamide formyltransferase/IMP cyclohydrolase
MPRALISVYDKTEIISFAQGLSRLGWDLLASGGTARLLLQNGIPVTEVANYTGSPEILDGRVKTLHPAIHAGILARDTMEDRAQLQSYGWDVIDIVAVNLYPFEETIAREDVSLDEAIEQIDIGGVALMRAAAKNHQRVTLVCEPKDYEEILKAIQDGTINADTRKKLAVKGFRLTARYDRAISAYLDGVEEENLDLYPVQSLRYGENPHQQATLLGFRPGGTPLGGQVLHGKELSYNNLLDLDAAWKAVVSFQKTSIVIVKHMSPCGIASHEEQAKAFKAALECDPVSAFGGIIASNKQFEAATAEAIGSLFVECIIAPGFETGALEILAKRKNVRLVQMPDVKIEPAFEYRSVVRGILRQQVDMGDPIGNKWGVVTERKPSSGEITDLQFAWRVCMYVKSNAIVFVKDEATVGIGGGQPNRVDCVHIAGKRAGAKSNNAVMASDAFFPFPDSVEAAAEYGITSIVQPGGSVRDQEVIDACNRLGISMVVTGYRHFRH